MPSPRGNQRHPRQARRWRAVAAATVALSVSAGVIAALDHGAPGSQARLTSVSVRQASGGWGGGYALIPGPGGSGPQANGVLVSDPASTPPGQPPASPGAGRKSFWSWYTRWHRYWYAYWHRHHPGPGHSPAPSPTGTATAAPTASATGTGVSGFTSQNWSGYAATGVAGSFTRVTAGWTIPRLTCTGTNTWASFWVGLDGDGTDTSTVEQTGTEANCADGKPVYAGWFELFPHEPVFYDRPVAAGDAMEASVTAEKGGVFMLTLADITADWNKVTRQTSATAILGAAEIIAEAPGTGQGLPLTNFGAVSFVGAALNDVAVGSAAIDEIIMDAADGATEVTPSAVDGGTGDFSVTWDDSGS